MMMKNLYKYRDGLLDNPLLKALQTWKFTALLLVVLSMQSHTTLAQSTKHKVSGKVTSAVDNQGIPGVSILIKGTTAGTATDIDGNFSIEAADTDVLTVSYIGYHSQEVPVGAKTTIDISLVEDIARLSEVVVVGYGLQKRTDISSAQTTIGAQEIQRTVNTTIEQAIQGRAAGVYVTQNTGQPGGGISVNVRGVSSITGSNEPLYVIDGVQLQPGNVTYGSSSSSNSLGGLNPADIESMEILQGPSATAIYGSRGTNGVVLITTKRGKSGEMKINYGFLYSLQDRPKEIPTMNLREFAQMTNEIRAIAGGNPPTEFQDPSVLGEGTNWQKELFNTAPLKKHQLSLSGGSEKTTVYLSGEYWDQDGVATGSYFKRYNGRLNIDNQTRKWLKLGTTLNISQTNENLASTQENVILNALQLAPSIPVRNPDGSWGGADATNGNSVQYTPLNPVAIANLVQNTRRRTQAIGGFNIEVKILKGLTFRTSLNGNLGFTSTSYFTPTWRLGNKTNDVASLSNSSSNDTYWNLNELVQYTTKIGRHDIGLMASHEAQESKWQNISGSRTGFVTNEIPDLSVGSTQGWSNGGGRNHWAMESFFGRANYSFSDKYIVQAAFRTDGSANFGSANRWGTFPSASVAWRVSQEPFLKAIPFINELKLRAETGLTGNQGDGGRIFGPLNAVSTPWGSGFLLGRYGNASLQWEETKTNNLGFNLSIFNNRIQLEGDFYVKKTDNLLMENPLPDYMGTAGEGSIGAPTVNIGALTNKGFGITLNTVNIDRGGFKWASNFNISGFKTKITKFYSEAAVIDRVAWYMGNWTQRAAVGQDPWLFRGYIQEGIFQSKAEIDTSAIPVDSKGVKRAIGPNSIWVGDIKYKDINNDGIINEKDQTNIGNPWPKLTFGFTNSFSYKGFDVSILLTASYGNDVFNYLRYVNTNPNNINLGRNMLKETFNYARVEGEGSEAHLTNPDAEIPRITGSDVNGNGARFTQRFVEDGSYIRIKNVNIAYNIPKAILSKLAIVQGARISFGMQNIATFTKYKGYDPEVGAYVGRDVSATSQSIGLDYGRYPLTPVYTFSIGVDF